MDVLQPALQPEPIIIEELEVKAGDTLSGIAKDKGVSLQSVIDANPQIKNPDMIRPGEVVSVPDPRLEGVPKPRGVADSPRLSEGVADPRKIGDAESTDAPVVAEETEADTGTDPRELGGAEGYGSVGTPPEADTGEGLMSDPRKLGGAEGYGNPVGDLSIFSKPVDNSYTEFMDIEGDTSHLGGADYKEVGITLPMGIVPTSGLKYTHNGTTIDLPKDPSKRWAELSKAGVTLKNFDASNVDMSQVVKDGIKRSDYNTDENFTKAVLSKFEDSVIKEIENEGVDVDKLDDTTLEGLISLAWNVQGHKWKDIEPAYKEMVKENPDMTKVQSGMLQVFTSNGIVVRGLAERRAKDYNKVAEGIGQPTIESYTPVKLKNGNAGFEYAMSDGTTVTRDTGKDYATKASQGSFKKHLNNATNL
jgi:LysM repeat protein